MQKLIVLRGVQPLFNKSHALIWNKCVSASVFIEKKNWAFCISSALVIMSHSLDAPFNSYAKNPPSSQLCCDVDFEEIYVTTESKLPSPWVHFKDQSSELVER